MSDKPGGVQVDGVSRRFGGTQAIEDVTFDVQPGEVLGLLGPNGAGKTTTMRVMTGYLKPTAGTVANFLAYCARLRRVPRSERKAAVVKAVRQAGLGTVTSDRIGTLSKGFRQRVALAQALVHDPEVLILDEPTAGLDPRQVVETRELIAKLGRKRSVLLSSHLLSEVANLCRRVVVLDHGRVLAVSDVATLTAAKETRLELRVSGDAPGAVGVIRTVAGVRECDERGGLIVVKGDGADLGQRVAAAVVDAGIGLLEQRVASTGTLEEAYLNLVRD